MSATVSSKMDANLNIPKKIVKAKNAASKTVPKDIEEAVSLD